ncbi:MAG TPA: hypothetical protein VFA89_18340 [Terriglobales bacterium]|nr:hypothetical protein [Terriglobales bacterium]
MRARTIASLMFTVLFFAALASAQSTQRVKANVPFAFTVGTKNFPAGQYSAVQTGPNLMTLRDDRGRSVATLTTKNIQSSKQTTVPKLTFVRRDGRYYLSQVWWQEDQIVDELPLPHSDAMLARQKSSSGAIPGSGGARP